MGKIEKAKSIIAWVLRKKKIMVHYLQKLCGFLNFLCRAIVPGRAFTRRLYAYTAGNNYLKPHHHITVKSDIRSDLAVWSQFLDHSTAYSRPFIDAANVLIADEQFWYTDSSKNPELGFGAICYDQWM